MKMRTMMLAGVLLGVVLLAVLPGTAQESEPYYEVELLPQEPGLVQQSNARALAHLGYGFASYCSITSYWRWGDMLYLEGYGTYRIVWEFGNHLGVVPP